jgi:hypothetical protein
VLVVFEDPVGACRQQVVVAVVDDQRVIVFDAKLAEECRERFLGQDLSFGWVVRVGEVFAQMDVERPGQKAGVVVLSLAVDGQQAHIGVVQVFSDPGCVDQGIWVGDGGDGYRSRLGSWNDCRAASHHPGQQNPQNWAKQLGVHGCFLKSFQEDWRVKRIFHSGVPVSSITAV